MEVNEHPTLSPATKTTPSSGYGGWKLLETKNRNAKILNLTDYCGVPHWCVNLDRKAISIFAQGGG